MVGGMNLSKFETVNSIRYFDKKSENLIVALEVLYEGESQPLFITGTFQGCTISNNPFIEILSDGNVRQNDSSANIVQEIMFEEMREQQTVGKYLSLIKEFLNKVADGNFTKFGMALIPICWIPDEFTILPPDMMELVKQDFDYVKLYKNGNCEFLRKTDI